MKQHIPLLILAFVAIVSIIGFAQIMSSENTGMVSKAQKQPYPGYSLVTTDVACNAIHCRIGYPEPAGVDESGHIICQCKEDPSWLQYRVTPFRTY